LAVFQRYSQWRGGHAGISRWFETFAQRPAAQLTLLTDNP
jgi:hypothetical protein